ncbi:MAG: EthD family reductase [Acidimicrobiia bacterium]
MIKSMTWFKRRPGLTLEQFNEYWRTTHAGLAKQLPGLRRYRQNEVLPGRGGETLFDGAAETWFDDTNAMRTLVDTDAYRTLMADEPNLMDLATRHEMLVDEHVIIDGAEPAGGFKFVTLVKRRPDLPVDEFQEYWRTVHGPLAARNPYIARYVQNHVRRRFYDGGRTAVWDGAAVTWFRSKEDMRASAQTPELAATRADEANFLADAGHGLPFFVMQERIIV